MKQKLDTVTIDRDGIVSLNLDSPETRRRITTLVRKFASCPGLIQRKTKRGKS